MVYSTYLWWFGGWFLIALTTLITDLGIHQEWELVEITLALPTVTTVCRSKSMINPQNGWFKVVREFLWTVIGPIVSPWIIRTREFQSMELGICMQWRGHIHWRIWVHHCDHALEIRPKWPAKVWGVRRPKVDIVHCRIQTNISLIEVLHIILTFGSIFDIGLLTSTSAAFLPSMGIPLVSSDVEPVRTEQGSGSAVK